MCSDVIFKTCIDVKVGTEIAKISILAHSLLDIISTLYRIIKLKIRLFFREFPLSHHLWACDSVLAQFQNE